jgi:hypothetical protein
MANTTDTSRQHGKSEHIRGLGAIRYAHPTPFWRAVHQSGLRLGGDEGGSSYRVGRDMYVQAHNGSDYYYFIAPYHFAR